MNTPRKPKLIAAIPIDKPSNPRKVQKLKQRWQIAAWQKKGKQHD